MTDLAMCPDDDCPIRRTCYRHPDSGTVPSAHQAWTVFKWNDGCADFLAIWPKSTGEAAYLEQPTKETIMDTIYNWQARRSGPNITIYGWDGKGNELKVVGIERLESDGQRVVAHGVDGVVYYLALGQPSLVAPG